MCASFGLTAGRKAEIEVLPQNGIAEAATYEQLKVRARGSIESISQ
jgi:hypothetical protein